MAIHQTSQAMQSLILIKLANYSTERMSNDLYYLMEAVNLMIQDYGEDKLKKEIENWDEKKEKLDLLNQLLARSKTFYDAISNKKFDKMKPEKVQNLFKKKYIQYASNIAVLQPELYSIAVYLINHSTIQNQTLRTEYIKVLEYQSPIKQNVEKMRAMERGR